MATKNLDTANVIDSQADPKVEEIKFDWEDVELTEEGEKKLNIGYWTHLTAYPIDDGYCIRFEESVKAGRLMLDDVKEFIE